jgi:L-aspartate oxidase
MQTADYLVIGAGVAGLSFALKAARHGTVIVLTKTDDPQESNSRYAQGGIAAVWAEGDNFESHIEDTLVAGAGLCRLDAVEQTVRHGPERIRELIALGVEFTRSEDNPAEYSLHIEGGHATRRILHAADLTGAEMVRALYAAASAHPNVRLLDHFAAIDLITSDFVARRRQRIGPADTVVHGCYALDERTGHVEVFSSRFTVLATGGIGRLYRFTTNPRIATGDGIAMAWRAGARVANMEFVQFHPTSLYHHKLRSFLVSEALRGEGGRLVHADGTRFMQRYDERLELAPRDVVARAIDAELKRLGLDCVYLDMTHLSREALESKFPNIYRTLASVGIDMAVEPIPVVPAAHYLCGGVQTDLDGRTSLGNLFAIGECACTGLHGANRLASNSLLEAVVFADTAAAWCASRQAETAIVTDLPAWDAGKAAEPDELVVIHQVWEEIRRLMWNYVGIVRTHRRMKRARRRIALVQEEIDAYYWDYQVTTDLIELRNLATVAELVVTCALKRHESRGLHYTLDFPETDDRMVADTTLVPFR